MRCAIAPIVFVTVFGGMNAQTPAKVDFSRDVKPILKSNCYGCHGPSQQMNNFRLDRRRDAMRGGTIVMIAPGSSQSSHLYLRLISEDHIGAPMPPTGTLPKEQVEIIKNWIDQGAEWPDAAAGETPLPPPDPKATRLMVALRAGNRQEFQRLLRENPIAVKAKGPGGTSVGGSCGGVECSTGESATAIAFAVVPDSMAHSKTKMDNAATKDDGQSGAVSPQARCCYRRVFGRGNIHRAGDPRAGC